MQDKHSCHDRLEKENIIEPSSTDKFDDIILPSQDEELFCLHLTQSQSNPSASQSDGLMSSPSKQTQGNTGKDGKNITPPCVTLSNTLLKQTPIGHPSTTGHHEDIGGNKTDTGTDFSMF